ncbi:MAG: hypothetical protein M3Z30_13430, partial [Gemmatimonadota bacterium]|nr:hypothetical protein [Gemmatimonadota bacterium]
HIHCDLIYPKTRWIVLDDPEGVNAVGVRIKPRSKEGKTFVPGILRRLSRVGRIWKWIGDEGSSRAGISVNEELKSASAIRVYEISCFPFELPNAPYRGICATCRGMCATRCFFAVVV